MRREVEESWTCRDEETLFLGNSRNGGRLGTRRIDPGTLSDEYPEDPGHPQLFSDNHPPHLPRT